MTAAPFRPLWDCAGAGCTHTVQNGHLERISPKGGPFLGLCQDCLHRGSTVLKDGRLVDNPAGMADPDFPFTLMRHVRMREVFKP